MRSRSLWYVILALVIAALSSITAEAVEPRLFGIRLRRDDFIGCRIDASVGSHGTVSMGEQHGLRTSDKLWWFRKIDGQFLKVGSVEVEATRQQSAVVAVQGRGLLEPNDLVVIPAARLEVWGANVDPLRTTVLERLVRNDGRNYYDTFDTEWNAREKLNQKIAEQYQQIDPRGEQRRMVRPERRVYYDLNRIRQATKERSALAPLLTSRPRDPNRLTDPLTGRMIGFPVEAAAAEVSLAEQMAAANAGITLDRPYEEPTFGDDRELQQFRVLRTFLQSQPAVPAE